jgi:hypothetical protein
MTLIERIDADLLGIYPLAGSALASGVRRALILLANSAKLFRAPEGRRKLAGGGAKRNHRYRSKKIVRVPAGTLDQNS